jgi:polygalacturonase
MNPPKFHVYFQGGTGITAWGVKLLSPADSPNTDGIDPASATNVTIAESWISTGDDGVAIKGNAGQAKNITIKNNHFYNTHGISIGSETLGVSNVLVANNTIAGADNGLRIKSNASLGGLVTGVTYLNTCLTGVKHLLLFDTHYTSNGSLSGSSIPVFTNITINGLKAVNSQSSASSTFDGFDAAHPIGLTMQSVSLDKTKISKASFANIGLFNTNITPSGTGVSTTTVSGTSAVPSCNFPAFPGL